MKRDPLKKAKLFAEQQLTPALQALSKAEARQGSAASETIVAIRKNAGKRVLQFIEHSKALGGKTIEPAAAVAFLDLRNHFSFLLDRLNREPPLPAKPQYIDEVVPLIRKVFSGFRQG